MTGDSLIFATGNNHKIEEVQSLLKGFALLSIKDIGITEDIPETSDTLEGNAMQKAEYVFERTGKPCFADDTGLEIEALGGEPGVRSARYAGECKNSEANMELVLQKLAGCQNRNARFRTVIAYIDKNGDRHLFEGIVNGHITENKRGNGGFGYDPVFVPDGYEKTFAELTLEEKNTLSHRARALNKFIKFLDT